MTHCVDFGATIQLLVDGELVGQDLDQALAHLQTCSTCRHTFEDEQKLSQLVRQSFSLRATPAALRNRIEQITEQTSASPGPAVAGLSKTGAET
jgi:anti-sigma factor (TIGR02949 family)